MIVYALVDPRDGLPFYVGKSCDGWDKAIRHTRRSERFNPDKQCRLYEIASAGLSVEVWPIAWARTKRELLELETQIIRQWSRKGLPLLNVLNRRKPQ